MSWVGTVLQTAQSLGVSTESVLAAAGINDAELQWERWPIDHITRLWRAAVELTGDLSFGLKAGSLAGPTGLNIVSFILQSAATLREALVMMLKYQRLISDGGRLQMIAGNEASWVIYHPRQGDLPFSPHQIEAVLAAIVAISRWSTQTQEKPLKVQLSQPAIGTANGYQAVFSCSVEFEQAFNGVLLSNHLLDMPLPQANPQLALMHRQYAQTRLAALATAEDLAHALRRWIAEHLPGCPPSRQQAAHAFSLSPRTLARHLQAQQLDYSRLVDEARRDVALQALTHSQSPISEIAQSLGFAEPSTFWRACRRWTGMTPSQWRRTAGRTGGQ